MSVLVCFDGPSSLRTTPVSGPPHSNNAEGRGAIQEREKGEVGGTSGQVSIWTLNQEVSRVKSSRVKQGSCEQTLAFYGRRRFSCIDGTEQARFLLQVECLGYGSEQPTRQARHSEALRQESGAVEKGEAPEKRR